MNEECLISDLYKKYDYICNTILVNAHTLLYENSKTHEKELHIRNINIKNLDHILFLRLATIGSNVFNYNIIIHNIKFFDYIWIKIKTYKLCKKVRFNNKKEFNGTFFDIKELINKYYPLCHIFINDDFKFSHILKEFYSGKGELI